MPRQRIGHIIASYALKGRALNPLFLVRPVIVNNSRPPFSIILQNNHKVILEVIYKVARGSNLLPPSGGKKLDFMINGLSEGSEVCIKFISISKNLKDSIHASQLKQHFNLVIHRTDKHFSTGSPYCF
jgi:hypothetical protein